jgi:adenylosuccinate synthase
MINGITELIMMKSDVLGGIPKINVCTAYNIEGRLQDTLPYQFENQKVEPIYKELDGWGSLDQVKYFRDLPASLQQYIRLIEDYVQVPVTLVSTGPGREQTLFR